MSGGSGMANRRAGWPTEAVCKALKRGDAIKKGGGLMKNGKLCCGYFHVFRNPNLTLVSLYSISATQENMWHQPRGASSLVTSSDMEGGGGRLVEQQGEW